ncbi:hypothetical protein HK101_007781 [Irineochytrium annulatum]|nr:hypothetical protein HK101_007781 [Irineochytrium annulatum]
MIISNPSSGKEEADQYVSQVREILESQQYEVVINETAGEGDAVGYCLNACKDGCDLVISIGGDGTLHETINGMMDQNHRPRLGIVPLGTVNDFARALNISLDPEEAIRQLRSDQTHIVDIGKINDRLFANVVAAGSLAEALFSVSSEEKSKLGSFAYLKEGLKDLVNTPANQLTIEYDGQIWEGESPLFLAALTNSVGGFQKLSPDAEVDDGTSLFFGNLKEHKDVDYFTAKEVHVRSDEAIRTNVDGEEDGKEAEHFVRSAMEVGANFFDHADIYGTGTCEEIFAEAVQMNPQVRENMILQSKCGIRKGMFDFSKEHILNSVDGILQRLKTEYLDVLLLHRPDALVEPEEVAEAFDQLEREGKVRHFGVSNQNPNQIELLKKYVKQPLVANQLQMSITNTTMIDSGINVNMENDAAVNRDGGILDYCRLHDITIQPWSPFQYGFFEGVFLGSDKFPELNAKIDEIAAKYDQEMFISLVQSVESTSR